jgi:hypothetical protein
MSAYRRIINRFGPGWLTRDLLQLPDGPPREVDSRAFYASMLLMDWAATRLRAGISARFIRSSSPDDALAYAGKGLDVIRGPDENRDSYIARLQTAIDDKRVAGVSWKMLSQIRGYCTPHAVRVRIINSHGNGYTIDRDGTQSVYRHGAWNWDNAKANALKLGLTRTRLNGDVSPAIPWSRFWVVIYPTTETPSQPWQRDGTWGDGSVWGDDGTTWGSTATPGDVFAIRRIVTRWKPLGSRCVSILICFDDTALDPSFTAPPLADGTWMWASKYDPSSPGMRVPARDSNCLFWDGSTPGSPL